MALPLCLQLPETPEPLTITLPGGVAIQQLNLVEAIQPALTPLVPLFNVVDTVLAVFDCLKAIPASLGPPPDPTVLASSLAELAEKVGKLLRLVPQLSLPYTLLGLIDVVVDTLRKARSQLAHLQQQVEQVERASERATELQDAGLLAVAACARANLEQEAANTGKALASLGKLVALLNLFLGMVGAPQVPDFSSLSGHPLDEVLTPIDAVLESLLAVRSAVPLP